MKNYKIYGYIYKTTNLVNNKFYIGQHNKSCFDKNYLGSGKLLKRAIDKYGFQAFKCEIIENCYSKEELNNREIFWIKKLRPQYNISEGGNGGNLGKSVNKKISNTLKEHWKSGKVFHHQNSGFKKGYVPWNKGKPGTMLGKHHSEETRAKMSEHRKGKIIPLKQRLEHSERMKGHPCSKEARAKMSAHCAMKRPECVEKARQTRIKNYRPRCWITNGIKDKQILCEQLEEYINLGWEKGRISARGKKYGTKKS